MFDLQVKKSMKPEKSPYVLGLDIGANSIGWAALKLGPDGKPCGLLSSQDDYPTMGVRVFEEGVDQYGEGDREQTRNAQRRAARLRRRQAMRRARRLKRTFRLLQDAGLLPQFPEGAIKQAGDERAARDALIKELDQKLAAKWAAVLPPDQRQVAIERLPYFLRARALDHRLEPYELGRALYHLAQRRGFQSNRKSVPKKDEKPGEVQEAITQLDRDMQKPDPVTGQPFARTLGEYFFKIDPAQQPIRRRWTSRKMYRNEFEKIWAAQAAFSPDLQHRTVAVPQIKNGRLQRVDQPLRDALEKALFHQRPLKSVARFIGECELEPGRKRAPVCFLDAQRFRMLQKVNDLRIRLSDSDREAPLSDEQRQTLIKHLQENEKLTFAQIRSLLKLPKGSEFNYERGGEKKLIGNVTFARFKGLFGDRWTALSPEEQEQAVLDLWTIQNPEALERRVRAKKGVWSRLDPSPDEAKQVAEMPLEDGYLKLSRRAIAKLLPHMERGLSFAEARGKAYPDKQAAQALDFLPPINAKGTDRASNPLKEFRNPVVSRALTELRKVVNALIRVYGKPELIRVELARDLKRNRKDRAELIKRMRENEELREQARVKLVNAGYQDPKGGDILRRRLADECGWVCPYTGRSFNMAQLMNGEVEVEHIIPFSRSLDDSYMNKTVCYADENRNKRDKTPYEAYGHDPVRWGEILQRMRKNVEDYGMPREKLRRFQFNAGELERFLDDFTQRQLNDTRYASVKAREYLTLLYGGNLTQGKDAAGKIRVQVGAGQVTAWLRNVLGLNRILGDGGEKTRDDYRHHAIDAMAIALTSSLTIQNLSAAASLPAWMRRNGGKVRKFGQVSPPWPSFLDDVRQAVGRILVSHRVSRRVRGTLHAETFYSKPQQHNGKTYSHVRRELCELKPSEVDDIVDDAVRAAIRSRLRELGETDPRKAFDFSRPETLPTMRCGHRINRIRKVRIRKANSTFALGKGSAARYVENENNHHLEIIETRDAKGKIKWEGIVVSLFEAVRRRVEGRPVVQTDHGEGKRFLFSLVREDSIELKLTENGKPVLYRVTGFSEFANGTVDITFALNCDARRAKERGKKGLSATPDRLRQKGCVKVIITPLGQKRYISERPEA